MVKLELKNLERFLAKENIHASFLKRHESECSRKGRHQLDMSAKFENMQQLDTSAR